MSTPHSLRRDSGRSFNLGHRGTCTALFLLFEHVEANYKLPVALDYTPNLHGSAEFVQTGFRRDLNRVGRRGLKP